MSWPPGFASYTAAQYRQFVSQTYGSLAPQVLARYPFSAYPHPHTASYAIGAIWTDSGFLVGIGGCPEQNLAQDFASTGAPTYFYQFDDWHAPGLSNNLPGYRWGAGHAMELAYLWPSFNDGFSLYALLTPAQLQLSHEMVRYWGAFAGGFLPRRLVDAPLQVADRPGAQLGSFGQLLLGQARIRSQLPQQIAESCRRLVRHAHPLAFLPP